MMDGEQDFAAFEAAASGVPASEAVVDAEATVIEAEPAEPEGDEPPVEEQEDGEPEGEEQPKSSGKTVQERIDKATREKHEARRLAETAAKEAAAATEEAAYWKGVANGTIKPTHGGRQEQPEADDAEPDPMNYDYGDSDPKYLKDVIAHGIRQGVDAAAKNMAQAASVQAESRAWEAKQDAARSKFADYDAVVIDGASEWPCSREMAQAIRTSDVGGELAYHLASNPDEARRLADLDPISQIRALGRLEASLDAQSAPQPAKTTSAPRPPEAQVRGAGGRFEPNAATTDFASFEALAKRAG